jgi:hypothetical protein
MTSTADFDMRRGSKRKSLFILLLYLACIGGSVALANFAGKPTPAIPTPAGMAE